MKKYIFGDAIDLSRSYSTYYTPNYFSVGAGATVYFEFITGAKDCLVIEYGLVTGSQSVRFKAYEAPTITDGTVAITPVAINRNSDTAPTLTLYSNPTNVSGGTVLVDELIPSGGNKTGGGLISAVFWTMKKNTKYAASVENVGNATTTATFQMAWHEI